MTEDTIVWEGPEELRPFLVEIGSIEPFPGNPRVGNKEAVAASLKRFGQAKLSVVIDGARIVAGHHVVQAATDLGWTHIAAGPNAFRDEDEQRAFLVADNRSSDLGSYDLALLTEQLRALAEIDALDGTGYSTDDLDGYLAELARAGELDPLPVPDPAAPIPGDPTDIVEVVLMYSKEQRDELEQWLKIIAKEKTTSGVSETIFEAARMAALSLHQGT